MHLRLESHRVLCIIHTGHYLEIGLGVNLCICSTHDFFFANERKVCNDQRQVVMT